MTDKEFGDRRKWHFAMRNRSQKDRPLSCFPKCHFRLSPKLVLVLSRSFVLGRAHSHQPLQVRGISNGGYFVCPRSLCPRSLSVGSMTHCGQGALRLSGHNQLNGRRVRTKVRAHA